jgi:O-glycosyl hydrolase
MFWGEKQAADFKRIVVKGYAKYALGFNEPNQQGQSDMSPQRGAQLWKQYLEPLAGQGYTLISPATTNAPSGKKWMQDFFGQCGGCTVSIVAVHWYGTKADEMIAYLKDIHATFGRPIWVTEYACQDFGGGPQANSGQVWAFHQQVKKFMDDTEWIKAYFAFGFMHNMGNVNPLNQLLGSNGKPTDLGYLYIN